MKSQKGFAHLLILITALGIITFLLVSSMAPFKDRLFSLLYPKSSSHASSNTAIYWGVEVEGKDYGNYGNPPWDMTALDLFESHAQKKVSIVHFGLPWYCSTGGCGYTGYRPFSSTIDAIRQRGEIPFVGWASADMDATDYINQPKFSLGAIIRGDHDTYITQWATAAKNWGHPFFLRFDHEMNGDWYPWSELKNGNSSGQYVQAWRHVHDIFTSVGANNVTWVWCPNVEYPGTIPLEGLYPGDNYVDWTCMDGYNWGTLRSSGWQSFSQVFKATYDHILTIAPNKPMVIGETASTESGGSKAAWITDMLATQLSNNFPAIKAFLWFNTNQYESMDWMIETSSTAQSAFASAIASPYYAINSFLNLNTLPIPPLAEIIPTPTPTSIPSPTPTPTPTSTPNPSPTSPPVQNYGAISGTVYSSVGGTVSGVKISTIVSGSKKTYYSDSSGIYSVPNLPPGTYSLTFQLKSYVNQTVSVSVTANSTTTKNVTLVKR